MGRGNSTEDLHTSDGPVGKSLGIFVTVNWCRMVHSTTGSTTHSKLVMRSKEKKKLGRNQSGSPWDSCLCSYFSSYPDFFQWWTRNLKDKLKLPISFPSCFWAGCLQHQEANKNWTWQRRSQVSLGWTWLCDVGEGLWKYLKSLYPELLSSPARTHSGQPESSAATLLLFTFQEGRPRTGKMALLI